LTCWTAPLVEIDYSDVAIPYTEKGYPKLYAMWGKKWVDDINTMMPLVVKRVAEFIKLVVTISRFKRLLIYPVSALLLGSMSSAQLVSSF